LPENIERSNFFISFSSFFKEGRFMALSKEETEVYQLRFWLREVSPMIWRRFLMKSDSTVADLHYCIQIAMGWSSTYLHQFIIHGKYYAVPCQDAAGGSDNACKVCLKDFQFRLRERFVYEYNFFDNWQYEIRIEQILSIVPKKIYPICIGGNYVAPPEDCGGPMAFMALTEHYSPWRIQEKFLQCLKSSLVGKKEEQDDNDNSDNEDDDEETIDFEEIDNTVKTLKYWVNRHQFNRRLVNRLLRRYAKGDDVNDIIQEGEI
jgi:hypothetical protein